MAISTYSELKAAIANFLARDDLTSVIPDFISLAEGRMSRELETRSQETRHDISTVSGTEFYTLPTDLREIREAKLETTPITVLDYMSPVSIDRAYSSAGTGKPKAFSVVGSEIRLRPVPDAVYTLEITYIGSITALSDSNASNTILSRHPDIYLSGSLAEAYTYLLDEQRALVYDQKFTRAIEEIAKDEERAHYGSGAIRINSSYALQNAAAER